MRRLASWLVYPALVSVAIVAMYGALTRGYDPGLAIAVISTACTLAVIALEQMMPYRRSWNRSHGDVVTDIVHGVFSFVAIPFTLQVLFVAAMYSASAWLADAFGFGLWPHHWPLYAQALLALAAAEFTQYCLHRGLHEVPLLWRLHATHHSAPRLYWLNLGRLHPLDAVLNYAVSVLFLALLGAPESATSLYLVYAVVHTTVQHSNVHVRLGPLNWIYSQAEAHRWHHSPDLAEGNNNYGTVLLIYDVLFGTRFLPKDRQPPEHLGLDNMPDFPTNYLGQLWSPVTWNELHPVVEPYKTGDGPHVDR